MEYEQDVDDTDRQLSVLEEEVGSYVAISKAFPKKMAVHVVLADAAVAVFTVLNVDVFFTKASETELIKLSEVLSVVGVHLLTKLHHDIVVLT